jgi:hypothetical protein
LILRKVFFNHYKDEAVSSVGDPAVHAYVRCQYRSNQVSPAENDACQCNEDEFNITILYSAPKPKGPLREPFGELKISILIRESLVPADRMVDKGMCD